MIQIIEENRRPTAGERANKAVGIGLEAYQKYQKQKQFGEALKNIEGIYGNPELNEQQRLVQTYQQLAGSDPGLAQHLGGQLSKLGGQQESFRNKIMGQQQEQNRLVQSFQNIQNLYNDPNLTEQQKTFGLYQELSQNPTLAHHLSGTIQQQNKARGEDVAGQQFSKGYNAILDEDEGELKEILEDAETPLSVKKQLTDFKYKHDTRKAVQDRELRNRQDLVQKSYQQAIKNALDKKKTASGGQKNIDLINKEIKRLEALQKHDLKRLKKDPNSYQSLSLWNNVDPEIFTELEEQEAMDAKAILDSLTDKEVEKLYDESGGDIEVAKKLAMERYSR